MKFSGLFEKLGIVIDLIINSNVFIIAMLLIIALFLLKLTNKISNKKMGYVIYFVELLVLGIVFYDGKEFLLKIGNKLIDNIFLNFYFPSLYVYLFVFVVSFIIFIYTLLNRYISKTYKIITNIYYLIFNFIFILLVSVISKNNINIFEKTSLFTNNDILVLLELSTLLFFLYLVINVLVYFTNYLIVFVEDKRTFKEKYNNELVMENSVFVESDIEPEENSSYSPNMAISFQELVKNLDNNKDIITEIELVPEIKNINNEEIKLSNNNEVVKDIKTNFKFIDPILFEEPIKNISDISEDKTIEKLSLVDFDIIKNEDKITLNDYKLFSNMLKTVIKNSNSVNLSINDILNKNLLIMYSHEEYSKFEKILNSCLN